MEDTAIAPEILGVSKKVLFVSRDSNWYRTLDRPEIALALVPVVVRVKHPIDSSDPELRKKVQNSA